MDRLSLSGTWAKKDPKGLKVYCKEKNVSLLNFQTFWVLLGLRATQVLSVPLKNRPLTTTCVQQIKSPLIMILGLRKAEIMVLEAGI